MAIEPIVPKDVPADKPLVHAMVVGVGHYADPALPGLDSVARSALAFTDWLSDSHAAPDMALGSIRLLASQPSGAPLAWREHPLAEPSSQNLQEAVDGWLLNAGSNPNNLAVFYFCGHGVDLGGGVQSLLLEDVNLNSADPFANAISLNAFVRGMDSCGARQQLFVIDACRELPPGFGRWDDDVPAGRAFVRLDLKARAKMQPRKNPVLQAVAQSQKAWQGVSGGWFTEALLTVLDGAAGNNRFSADPAKYPVNTRDITSTIEFLVKNDYLPTPAGPQNPRRSGDDDFDLHLPNPPKVPVVVLANRTQAFTARCAGQVIGSLQSPWRERLAVGQYEFEYGNNIVRASIDVPARKVELP